MATTLTIDKAGRVVLPKSVRDEMHLRAGDSLELESSEDRIVLRPRRGGVRLHRKQGAWVLSSGRPISAGPTDKVLRGCAMNANSDLWKISRCARRDGKRCGEIESRRRFRSQSVIKSCPERDTFTAAGAGDLDGMRVGRVPRDPLVERFRDLLAVAVAAQPLFVGRAADEGNFRQNSGHRGFGQDDESGLFDATVAQARIFY